MYYNKAIREPNRDQFITAIRNKWLNQYKHRNLLIVPRQKLPKGAIVLPSVWAMQHKRDIKLRHIKKYKAQLNVYGSKQIKGEHYDKTYLPVATWGTICLVLTLVATLGWNSQ